MLLPRPASLAFVSLTSPRASLLLVFAPLLALGACSKAPDPDPVSPQTGGSSGKTGGSSGQTGGASGQTGGSSGGAGSGGTSAGSSGGSGGTTPGTGGAPGSGGSGTPDASASGGAGGGGGSDAAVPSEKFSFFVTSWDAMKRLSKSDKGFGGDLRYGQPDGVSGADKICTEIAESALPGSGAKGWRAFLSAAKGPGGTPVNAIDRVGNGPWYDRKGRLLAMTKADLVGNRPKGADPMIVNDFPNEFGINNSHPVVGGPEIDNHHFLTGSNPDGTLKGTNTCDSWTTLMTTPTSRPQIGFSFVIQNRSHWISGQTEGGCGAGFDLDGGGGSNPANPIVGSGGGYGGIYCFALQP
jgi:hypothetical protein